METTSIFLGSKGLSQSEANHTANVAKEIAETQEENTFLRGVVTEFAKS